MDEAYAAGMKPHEFFDLTPGEVSRWLGPAWKGRVETAFWMERMRRVKRLPAKAGDLFKTEMKPMTAEQMVQHSRAFMAEMKKNKDKARAVGLKSLPRKGRGKK